MEVPTASSLRRLKVVELRQKLSKLRLPQAGIKEELISRLINYYQEQHDAEQEQGEGGVTREEADEADITPQTTEKEEEGGEEDEPVAMDTAESIDQQSQHVASSGGMATTEEADAVSSTDPSTGEGIAVDPPPTTTREPSNREDGSQSTVVDTEPSPAQQDSREQPPLMEAPAVPEEGGGGSGETAGDAGRLEEEEEEKDRVSEVAQQSAPMVSEDQQVPPTTTLSASEVQDQHQPDLGPGPPPANVALLDRRDTPPAVSYNAHATSGAVNSIATALPPPPLLPPPHPVTTHPLTTLSPQPLTAPIPLFPRAVTSDYYSDSSQDQLPHRTTGGPTNEQGPANSTPLPAQPVPNQGNTATKEKHKKKKKRRRRRHDNQQTTPISQENSAPERSVEVEYIQEDILAPDDPNYRHFHRVMESFKLADPSRDKKLPREGMGALEAARLAVADATRRVKEMRAEQLKTGGQDGMMAGDSSDEDDEGKEKGEEEEEEEEEEEGGKGEGGEGEAPKLSKKKLRRLNRLTVAQLKQLVERPDVVEMHDVTAQDPKLLVVLKSTRNAVPVPRHWCFKRKYLQGKRGIEKPPFDLPDFIKSTGVMEMRQALDEKEDAKSLKQKTRERVRPKMGKLTIDYQKLHDAFFKWQTKPSMSIHGDLYYEGKEFETRLRQKKPGDLSDDLRRALGMPTGAGKHRFPPPWLVAMQRYGPPPSYPNLKIPGLSAPIPDGCSFGYFVGGWGKPPVDEKGRPLYGDVFGLDQPEGHGMHIPDEDAIDKSFWGELESEEEEEEEEEESEEEGAEDNVPKPEDIQAGLVTPLEGLVTPSGLTSIPAGLETPEMIQLRKKKIEEAMEQGGETPTLYTVLPEKASAVGAAMMGSSHVYDVASAVPAAAKKGSGAGGEGGVAVALDISELDMDSATMTARYEQQIREQQGQLQKEDLSDMVAEHAAKQKKRKRTAADSGGKATKKLKEFKF